MRTRETILEELSRYTGGNIEDDIIIELLLDIRETLKEMKK